MSAFAKQERRFYLRGDAETRRREYFEGLRKYAKTHGHHRRDHAPVRFVGLWDTVKAAGTLSRPLRWPFSRQLPHAKTIRHAVSIDESRRPFAEYLVAAANPKHLLVERDQDLNEVWFAGVHCDVGGMFEHGTPLSDIPLKWMIDEAIDHGLPVRRAGYADVVALTDVVDPTGPIPLVRRSCPIHARMWTPTGVLAGPCLVTEVLVDCDRLLRGTMRLIAPTRHRGCGDGERAPHRRDDRAGNSMVILLH